MPLKVLRHENNLKKETVTFISGKGVKYNVTFKVGGVILLLPE